jgi:hypothetical protein
VTNRQGFAGWPLPVVLGQRSVVYDSETRAVTMHVRADVEGALADVAQASDPQSWSRFSPFFAETYRVDGAAYRRVAAAPIGTPWRGHLYERFVGPLLAFENILAVETTVTANSARVAYRLHDSLSWTTLGTTRPGVIEVDCGAIHAVERGRGVYEVTVEKTLVFSDRDPWARWFGLCAPLLVRGWVELHAWLPGRSHS